MKDKRSLCDLLLPRIQTAQEWEAIYIYLQQCDQKEVSSYELYLALGQENIPVPLHILKVIMEKKPCLVNDHETYNMNCKLAYFNEHTSFEIVKYLLDVSHRSFELANVLIRMSLKADFNRFDVATDLIRYEPSVLTYCNHEGNMPIHECCMYCESPAMVQLLVDEGLIFSDEWLPRNSDGMSAIEIALESEFIEGARIVLSILIHASPEFQTKSEVEDNELLHVAARIGDLFFARHILNMYPELIHAHNKENATPLHLACLHSIPTMIQFLLDKEVALKVPSAATEAHKISRFTPVQLACANADVNIVTMQSLLSASQPPHPLSTMVWKYRLLHITAMGTNVELARYFINLFPQALGMTSNTGCLPIRFAVATGSSKMVELLLCKGMQLFGDRCGLLQYKEHTFLHTTLQLACSNSRLCERIVKRLFKCTGVTVHKVLDGNFLSRAVKCNNLDVAKFILHTWPSALQKMDKDGNLPLHLACSSKSPEMLRFVFSKSVKNLLYKKHQHWDALSKSIFQKNRQGLTPWHLMCESFSNLFDCTGESAFSGGTWSCIKLIIYLKGGMLQMQPNGNLPLLHAAIIMISNVDMLWAVLVHHALPCKVNAVDYKRRNALHIAAEQAAYRKGSWRDIIEYLVDVEHNGKKCAFLRDDSDRLPLHSATANKMCWRNGLNHITEANPSALGVPDPVTNLYPFMLVASIGPASNDLNSVYKLLRLNPEMIGITQ